MSTISEGVSARRIRIESVDMVRGIVMILSGLGWCGARSVSAVPAVCSLEAAPQ
jgi:hypothetical protein